EGTYPYIKGGVSSWVHQIVSGLPELRFAVIFLGSRREDYGPRQYDLPGNVVHIEDHFLFGDDARPSSKAVRRGEGARAVMADIHQALRGGDSNNLSVNNLLDPQSALSERAFLYSEEAWDYICHQYETVASEPSFVDYFWSVRNLHAPLWVLARAAAKLPPSRLFFSPSTGYAGLLGVLAAQHQQRRLVLMEHGIYTKERRIDLMNAQWIRDSRNILQRDPTEVSYLRELWVRFFEVVGRLAYQAADPIISLFEHARSQQVRDGAPADRTRIIPNGVDVGRLARVRRPPGEAPPPVICLLGRVVSIKDIKTFIRAAATLREKIPDLQAWIVGPEDEDPAYSAECHDLVQVLDLQQTVSFLGFRRIDDIFPQVGVLVLSSISEGLPLSVIEGFAAGIPAVATDVGACAELINGRGDHNDVPGRAGRVVGLADPAALAAACLELLSDSDTYHNAVATAIARVETLYGRDRMLAAFAEVFRGAMGDESPRASYQRTGAH
ncbi:MAG: GT4 family glycosyltransferase PelF, partial [Marinobacter sp.]|nr:GT4 family glycosyltransferase PelF [Marinobacter sp.]